jgi:phospholipase/carboxylesterase
MDLLYTAHVPAGEGPFPSVIALHGWGASAHDLLGLAPVILGGQALVLCPQGPIAFAIGPGLAGHGWFPIREGGPLDLDAFAAGAAAIREFVDRALERYPVDRERLVLMGFSQGGVMAYDLFLREPARFAGLAALSSWLPQELSGSIPQQPAHENRPVLVLHGTRDPMMDVARGRESREALRERRVALRYREYDMGHEISAEALRELVAWLDETLGSRIISP